MRSIYFCALISPRLKSKLILWRSHNACWWHKKSCRHGGRYILRIRLVLNKWRKKRLWRWVDRYHDITSIHVRGVVNNVTDINWIHARLTFINTAKSLLCGGGSSSSSRSKKMHATESAFWIALTRLTEQVALLFSHKWQSQRCSQNTHTPHELHEAIARKDNTALRHKAGPVFKWSGFACFAYRGNTAETSVIKWVFKLALEVHESTRAEKVRRRWADAV